MTDHRSAWFATERPTDTGTVYLRPHERETQLSEFHAWLARQEAGGATVVRIEAVRKFFGWFA